MKLTPLILAVAIAGCSGTAKVDQSLILATTTSTRDSGLLDRLVPLFEQQTGIRVKVVAVGSGQALELGRRGDADVLLTHAPEAERLFMDEGYGERRLAVMHNEFVLVGPRDDPAQVGTQATILDAFRQIARQQAPFVSRGDRSGTQIKEQQLWKESDVQPSGPWYLEAGMGMAEVLRMASEKGAYTLSDRATFLAHRKRLDLVVLSQRDPLLENPYAVIVVKPTKHPHVAHAAARRFADFLVSAEAQSLIRTFGQDEFGEPLFTPPTIE